MRRKSFILSACIFLVAMFFNGCSDDQDSIRICNDFIATVVHADNHQYLLQIDGGARYYNSQKLNLANEAFVVGDRIYFHYFEINYDKQPAGANGTQGAPYDLTNVLYEKMDVRSVLASDDPAHSLGVDTLELFYLPYLEHTSIHRDYLNLSGILAYDNDALFNLVYQGLSNDTLIYDFKTSYPNKGSYQVTYAFIETFQLENLPPKGFLKIRFKAFNHEDYPEFFPNDSTCVIPFQLNP